MLTENQFSNTQSLFKLNETHAGLSSDNFPNFALIEQTFARPQETDITEAVKRELSPLLTHVKPGQKIAITGSSRGIVHLSAILNECVKMLKEKQAQPFIFPAMGSHGGATAEGQIQVLEAAGITEASMQCPIQSSMEVIQVGTTSNGFPVYQDKIASEADGVLVINRIKPHTGFTCQVESGICKMLVIGMGKQAGASRIHQQALQTPMGDMILEASEIILHSPLLNFIGALALVENAFKETAQIKGIPLNSYDALVSEESALLKKASELLPRIPFSHLEGLVVNEIGKNISGSGMDTNVIGKKPGMSQPDIGAIYIRSLSPHTHGNALGIGLADIMPKHLIHEVDFNATYMNAYTAKRLTGAKVPLLTENDVQAMMILLSFRQDPSPASARLMWIQNTSQLDRFWVSEALVDEVNTHPDLELLTPPTALTQDASGMLTPRRIHRLSNCF